MSPLLAVPVVPAAVGLALALTAGRWTGARERSAVLLAVAVSLVGVVLVAVLPSGAATRTAFLAVDLPGAGIELQLDALGRTASLVVAVVLLAVVVVTGNGSLHDAVTDDVSGTSRPRLLGLLLLFAAGMHTTVLASSLPALLVGWELMGAASGLLVAAVGKAAQLPLSGWLSRAMLGPSPVSALLHSATMVAAGGFLLVRLAPLLSAHTGVATAAVVIGLLTGVVLGAVASAQSDLKQLLAASTSAQVSVVVVAGGLGAVAGGTAHLVGHALVKAALFLAAGLWLTSTGSRQLADLKGIARRRPVLGLAATVAAVVLAGLPPLPLWATKDLVLAGAGAADLGVPAAVVVTGLLLVTVLSGVYGARLVMVLWARPEVEVPDGRREDAGVGARSADAVVVGLVLLALPGALLAVPDGEHRGAALLADPGRAPSAALMAVSGAAAAAGAFLARLLVGRATGGAFAASAVRWFGRPTVLERAGRAAIPVAGRLSRWNDAAHSAVVIGSGRTLRTLARSAAGSDDVGHETVVRGIASRTAAVADAAGDRDVRDVHGAVLALAGALRRLGGAARRPQTGLLHQYYFQLAAGAGVLLALLLLVPT